VLDIAFVVLSVGFFLVGIGYAVVCYRLMN
jgi:hypothetical protein